MKDSLTNRFYVGGYQKNLTFEINYLNKKIVYGFIYQKTDAFTD